MILESFRFLLIMTITCDTPIENLLNVEKSKYKQMNM